MGIYEKARTKIAVSTVIISLCVVLGLWSLLFIADYIMFNNNMPILFAKSKVEEIDGKHITVEKGFGYYVITNEQNISEFYFLGHKIK